MSDLTKDFSKQIMYVGFLFGFCLSSEVLWAASAFQENAGQVVIEAETVHASISRNGASWNDETPPLAGYSGAGYRAALPNANVTHDTDYASSSPEVQYLIKFSSSGTYYVWIRAHASSTADDSLHVGLDGTTPTTADRISSSALIGNFGWTRSTLDGPVASLAVPSSGVHVLQVWAREDGFRLDKILLTKSTGSTPPTGTGPAQSSLSTVYDATGPTVPGLPTEGGTVDQDTDSDGAYTVFWTKSTDVNSAVTAYEVQERIGTAGAWTTLSSSVTITSLPLTGRSSGTTHYYRVRAKNGAGLWSNWSSISDGITIQITNQPPAISATEPSSPVKLYIGTPTVVSITASDPNGDSLQYQILLDGAVLFDWSTSASRTWSPTSAQRGQHTLTLNVRDGLGGEAARNVSVLVIQRPVPPS